MYTYDRYSEFRYGDDIKKVPFVKIPEMDTDFYETYKINGNRLDQISSQYYNNPNYGWLILLANPEVGGLEYRIQDGTQLRIPYPLNNALSSYVSAIKKYEKEYIV